VDEKKLLDDARDGNREALKKIIMNYQSKIDATVTGMLGLTPEVEDIGQETFIRFFRSLDKFREDSSIGTYLIRIAINLSLNELKRRKRQKILFHLKQEEKINNNPDGKVTENRKEAYEIVHRGLQKLPYKFRSVLVLRLIDGYTTRETSEILNLPQGTVLSRLARGQEKLRRIVTPLYEGNKNKNGDKNE
jgi:RNA polymerase sigma-70 factor (ECF subfamily)